MFGLGLLDVLRREGELEDMPIDVKKGKRETADCWLCIR